MGKSYNKTIIIGRLGKDPELSTRKKAKRESDISQQPDFASFTLLNSTVDQYRNEIIQSHDIHAFGKQAILCHEHLHKGDLCCVEGRIDERMIGHCKPGQFPTIIAERITFLSSRKRKEVDNECAISADGQ